MHGQRAATLKRAPRYSGYKIGCCCAKELSGPIAVMYSISVGISTKNRWPSLMPLTKAAVAALDDVEKKRTKV